MQIDQGNKLSIRFITWNNLSYSLPESFMVTLILLKFAFYKVGLFVTNKPIYKLGICIAYYTG